MSIEATLEQLDVLALRLSDECGFDLTHSERADLCTAFKKAYLVGRGTTFRSLIGEPGRSCRFCTCTDERACVTTDGVPCHWVSEDVCSACAPAARKLGFL